VVAIGLANNAAFRSYQIGPAETLNRFGTGSGDYRSWATAGRPYRCRIIVGQARASPNLRRLLRSARNDRFLGDCSNFNPRNKHLGHRQIYSRSLKMCRNRRVPRRAGAPSNKSVITFENCYKSFCGGVREGAFCKKPLPGFSSRRSKQGLKCPDPALLVRGPL
jgi:hypothetical protein